VRSKYISSLSNRALSSSAHGKCVCGTPSDLRKRRGTQRHAVEYGKDAGCTQMRDERRALLDVGSQHTSKIAVFSYSF
jgi:hypothetical protein